MPDLFLCLDLDGTEEAVEGLPDDALFSAKHAGDVMLLDSVQGPGWLRCWRAFPGTNEGKEAAALYSRQNPTLIAIPITFAPGPAPEDA